jgi:rhodanese-related sulfurtransferase
MFQKGIFNSVKNLTADDLHQIIDNDKVDTYTLLDVRTPKEYARSHLPGATHIPVAELADRLDELDPGKPIIAY